MKVVLAGVTIADTVRGWRVLETSHPPVYYFPPEDLVGGRLVAADRTSVCEWKGVARYFDVVADGCSAKRAGWVFPEPTPAFTAIRGHLAFYASAMDACYVDGERVRPQAGGFYGGWITGDLVGPFKGDPGTELW